jgi:hypothetical protein
MKNILSLLSNITCNSLAQNALAKNYCKQRRNTKNIRFKGKTNKTTAWDSVQKIFLLIYMLPSCIA